MNDCDVLNSVSSPPARARSTSLFTVSPSDDLPPPTSPLSPSAHHLEYGGHPYIALTHLISLYYAS